MTQVVICTNAQRHAKGYVVGAIYAPGWRITKITQIHEATDTCQLDLEQVASEAETFKL